MIQHWVTGSVPLLMALAFFPPQKTQMVENNEAMVTVAIRVKSSGLGSNSVHSKLSVGFFLFLIVLLLHTSCDYIRR